MPFLLPLLARRQADPPRYRTLAQLPSEARRARLHRDYAAAASLEAEELANRTDRSGDVPHDFSHELVPIDERSPHAGLAPSGADEDGWTSAEEVLQQIRASGITLAEGEERALADIQHAIDDPTDYNIDGAMDATRDLLEQLARYADPAAHRVVTMLGAQLEHIGTLGWHVNYGAMPESPE